MLICWRHTTVGLLFNCENIWSKPMALVIENPIKRYYLLNSANTSPVKWCQNEWAQKEEKGQILTN